MSVEQASIALDEARVQYEASVSTVVAFLEADWPAQVHALIIAQIEEKPSLVSDLSDEEAAARRVRIDELVTARVKLIPAQLRSELKLAVERGDRWSTGASLTRSAFRKVVSSANLDVLAPLFQDQYHKTPTASVSRESGVSFEDHALAAPNQVALNELGRSYDQLVLAQQALRDAEKLAASASAVDKWKKASQ